MAKKSAAIFCLLYFSAIYTFAQLNEHFDDGDITSNPSWSGNISDFIVDAAFKLQSNSMVAGNTFYISTTNTLSTIAEWEVYVELKFNPSSANYVDIYLVSKENDLTLPGNSGYFVRLGNTDDEISLYRKDDGVVPVKLIDGEDGILNKSSNTLRIKVTRDAGYNWSLYRDERALSGSYFKEGAFVDSVYTSSSFFGILVKQSTSSFFQKHFFDDIIIQKFVPDTIPPAIKSVNAVSQQMLDIYFSEPLDIQSAEQPGNYFVNNIGNPVTAILDGNTSIVHLTFAKSFAKGVGYTLSVNDVKDLQANVLSGGTVNFIYNTVQHYDVVIDEIMSDPSPVVGLPNYEWIEIRNRSAYPLDVNGWKLANLRDTSGPFPSFSLQPDSLLIICGTAAFSSMSQLGKADAISGFPSLDNTGDLIALLSAEGQTIHAINYSEDWYQNNLKKEGGWTLEMIDVNSPCSGKENWRASIDGKGGTPGKINSINGKYMDDQRPRLLSVYPSDDTVLIVTFDEPIDSTASVTGNHFQIDKGMSVKKVEPSPPLFDQVKIYLNSALIAGEIYTVNISGLSDCKGNTIAPSTIQFGKAQDVDSLDIVINEILFNPKPGGVDYVELYNRSDKILDLSNVYIANRNSSNAIGNFQIISEKTKLFLPGTYLAVTTDVAAVLSAYIVMDPAALFNLNSMPSFSDDKGDVVIIDNQGNIIDEVAYSDKWHFQLISNTEGISLERIDVNGQSVQSNFHSAATSAGYGTPGYKNSQYSIAGLNAGEIKITPEIFSPDNDGIDDFATIQYTFPAQGYVTNITIFDANGRPVRYLQKNSLSGINGYYRWDGLDDKNRALPQGAYIIYTEIFNADGKKKQFKNTIVLARRY